MSDQWLDIFNSDAFSFTSLVASINKIQFIPGRVGSMGLFVSRPVSTLTIAIEEKQGQLSLVDPTPRGGPGETRTKLPRAARQIAVPHYQVDDAIFATELQGVREFGTNAPRSFESFMSDRMSIHTANLDATLEYQRIGALCGLILDKNGNTLYDLNSEFGVTAPTAINFVLSVTTTNLRAVCATVTRTMQRNLGGTMFTGVYALVGDAFWDLFITHAKVEATYQYQEGRVLRQGIAYKSFEFGDITWENYKGYIAPIDGGADNGSDAQQFLDKDTARFFPIGAPNLFATYFAPADYFETVNTMGLPRYAKVIPSDNGKSAALEMQTNPLSLCHRPRALLKGTHS